MAGAPAAVRFRGDACNVGAYLVNVGEGGAFVRCTIPVEIGRDLVCAFQLGATSFLCKGRVSWVPPIETRRSTGPGFGVTFAKPQPVIGQLLS